MPSARTLGIGEADPRRIEIAHDLHQHARRCAVRLDRRQRVRHCRSRASRAPTRCRASSCRRRLSSRRTRMNGRRAGGSTQCDLPALTISSPTISSTGLVRHLRAAQPERPPPTATGRRRRSGSRRRPDPRDPAPPRAPSESVRAANAAPSAASRFGSAQASMSACFGVTSSVTVSADCSSADGVAVGFSRVRSHGQHADAAQNGHGLRRSAVAAASAGSR